MVTYLPQQFTLELDFYLLSSKIEGSPLSLIETAFTGINCISTPSSPAILELCKDFPNVHVCNENSLESFSKAFHDIVTKYISSQNLHSFKTPNSFYSLDECMAELLKNFRLRTLIFYNHRIILCVDSRFYWKKSFKDKDTAKRTLALMSEEYHSSRPRLKWLLDE